MAIRRRRPTRRDDDNPAPSYTTPEEVLAALPDDPRASEIQTAYDRLRALGVNGTVANQLIRDRVNGTDLASDPEFGNSDSDGDMDPDRDDSVPTRTSNPVINFVEDRMGGPEETALGGSGTRLQARGKRRPAGDDDDNPTREMAARAVEIAEESGAGAAQQFLAENGLDPLAPTADPNWAGGVIAALRDAGADEELIGWAEQQAGVIDADAEIDYEQQMLGEEDERADKADVTISAAAQSILDAVERGDIINKADAVAMIVDAGYSPTEAGLMFEAAQAKADEELSGDEDPEPGQPRPTAGTVVDTPAPEWIMQLALNKTGAVLTPAQEGRIVEYWNAYNGTDYGSLDELTPFLEDANLNSQQIVEAALLDENAEMALQVRLPGGGVVSVSQSNVANLMENFGFDVPGIQRIARLMNLNNDMPLPYDDPQDNLLITASILRALNLEDDVSLAEETEHEREQREERYRSGAVRRPGTGMFYEQERRESPRIQETPEERLAREIDDPRSVHRPSGEELSFIVGQTQPRRMNVNIADANRDFREGWERYQDVGLAMLHTFDEGLAARIWSTGGDPSKLSAEDDLLAWSWMRRSVGEQAENWQQIAGEGPVVDLFRRLQEQRAAGGGGGGGRMRRMLDPVGVGEQYRAVTEALFGTTPPPEEIQSVVNRLQAELDAAPEGMAFDIAARLRDVARGHPLFQELYGAKPDGMTEEQFRGMFQAVGEDFAGPGVSEEAVRAGMKSNSIQGTVGYVAGDKAMYRDNSTFLGRLANIAQTIEEFT